VHNSTKVRFTFVEKVLENADGFTALRPAPRRVIRYYEPVIYREFFNQLDKNIYIENNKI